MEFNAVPNLVPYVWLLARALSLVLIITTQCVIKIMDCKFITNSVAINMTPT